MRCILLLMFVGVLRAGVGSGNGVSDDVRYLSGCIGAHSFSSGCVRILFVKRRCISFFGNIIGLEVLRLAGSFPSTVLVVGIRESIAQLSDSNHRLTHC